MTIKILTSEIHFVLFESILNHLKKIFTYVASANVSCISDVKNFKSSNPLK